MGRGGTEVAKGAADMVLTDDNFATIEAPVEEGRCVFDNLNKFIVWTLPTNVGEAMIVLVAICLGVTLPALSVQLLWINMATAVLLGMTLAFETKEPGLMERPPRDPRQPLLTFPLFMRTGLVSLLTLGGAFGLFNWENSRGASLAEARTAVVNVIVFVQLFCLFNCRSLTRSSWSLGALSNLWLLGGVAAMIAAQMAFIYLPFMNEAFHSAPLDPAAWLRVIGVALAASLIVGFAVIVTPAATVPGIIAECVDAGAKGAIIISAGFRECGAEGVELEKQVLTQARRGKMRIIGPNCLGVMRPHAGLNATFAASMSLPGSVGFLSQSGALCTAILDWSLRENVGFSAFVSVGSMLDVNWGDLIYYLGDDPHTRSFIVYMESIGDARSFLSAAREVALTKPIIVIKVGRTAPAAKAAASHTGSLTGSDEVLDAAFRRAGVLRVDTIAELFDMAEVLAKQPRPRTPRLAIVTNAGGPAALATDMLVSTGGQTAQLSRESIDRFNQLLPPHWSRNNPVDLLGDAGAERYAKAVESSRKIRTTTEYSWSSRRRP